MIYCYNIDDVLSIQWRCDVQDSDGEMRVVNKTLVHYQTSSYHHTETSHAVCHHISAGGPTEGATAEEGGTSKIVLFQTTGW